MNSVKKPFFNGEVILEKFPGKGGWTYARVPGGPFGEKRAFGWQKAGGFIDDFELKDSKIWPMKEGSVFLPVKAEIRKNIKKEAGDLVTITLFSEELPVIDANDFLLCLEDDPEALKNFLKLSKKEQKQYTDWIVSARSESLKVERIAAALERLASGSGKLL
ncbi:YdeI/OmpD-associated family protein [Desertivirga xinjiangensis]|uniref:YdeI/OmpD-associated family protein n=1 Tax=Desertivirga xinjiangensis TaxID=539206 RepID=UPI00210CDF6F|nr:YdeI/OmpD-associated family protein [Pedobacter xinjiangensis]